MTTRIINSKDSAVAADIVRVVRERPNDLIDPFPPSIEMEVLCDMGARGKEETTHARVAVEGGVVVGYGALDHSPEMKRALLVGPVIHPAHRTKGLGRALLDDLLNQARQARQRHVRTMVGSQNKAGQALLKSAGFKQRERHTCLRLTRPEQFPGIELDGIEIRRVDDELDDVYFEFTRRFVPRQPKQTRSLLKTDSYCAILAFKKNKPVGCVEVDFRHSPNASIENLDAPPSLLHKGLGNALLSEAVRAAFDREDIETLDLLMSGTDRARLEALVEHGFEIRHELIAYELRL
jgi:ribosomal protein S18 acetylase RimI-like enzyme